MVPTHWETPPCKVITPPAAPSHWLPLKAWKVHTASAESPFGEVVVLLELRSSMVASGLAIARPIAQPSWMIVEAFMVVSTWMVCSRRLCRQIFQEYGIELSSYGAWIEVFLYFEAGLVKPDSSEQTQHTRSEDEYVILLRLYSYQACILRYIVQVVIIAQGVNTIDKYQLVTGDIPQDNG